MLNVHYSKNKKVESVTDQNKTDKQRKNLTLKEFALKKRAAKKEPTGMEIRMGENSARPKAPYFRISKT